MHGTLSPSLIDQTRLRRPRHASQPLFSAMRFEWFDFTLYGFFAPVIATVLFPATNQFTALLLAIATFGVGFVTRPLGGIVLGIYADRRGRRPALALSALLMALGTALIRNRADLRASRSCGTVDRSRRPFVARVFGRWRNGRATAYLNEIAPTGRRAFYTSWIQSSVGLAIVCGNARFARHVAARCRSVACMGVAYSVCPRRTDRSYRLCDTQPPGGNACVHQSHCERPLKLPLS